MALVLSPALLSLACALPQASADDGPVVLEAPALRPGRTRVELVLLGESWPDALARVLRSTGTEARALLELEQFLDERRSAWILRAREFGLELVLEAPDDHIGAVLEGVAPALLEPRWTPEALGRAAVELLVARVPGQFDPVARADRELAGLFDPRVEPPAVLDVDLGALMAAAQGGGDPGGEDGDGRGDGTERGGGRSATGAPAVPGPEPLDPDALARSWRRSGAGGLAARVSAADPGPTAAAVRALAAELAATRAPAPVEPPGLTPADEARHLGGPRVATRAADAMTPGAIVAFGAPLDPAFARWSPEALAAWSAGLGATLAERLPLQAGTAPRVVVRRADEGVPSVRVTVLVEPTETALAAAGALVAERTELLADPATVAGALADGPLAVDPLAELVDVARGLTRPETPAADAGPAVVFERLVVVAPEALLPGGWRLDRSPAEQTAAPARAWRERVLAALGGAEAWSTPTRVALSTAVEVAPGRTVETRQWRDLRAARLRLEQRGTPRVVTVLDGGRATQQVADAAPNLLAADTALQLIASHRGSLLVTLVDLARDELRVELLSETGPDGPPEGGATLGLTDRLGPRGRLTVDADGLPLALEQDGRRYTYAEWTTDDGPRVPRRVERAGPRPVTYRWSQFDWDPPTPAGL